MPQANDFNVQIGSVYSLETDVMMAAQMLATVNETNVGLRAKIGAAGPNDLIYVLLSIDLWRDLIPWAGISIASGALGASGKALYERYFSQSKRIHTARLSEHEQATGDAFNRLMEKIRNTERYWEEESNVRLGLHTTKGDTRHDVGYHS